MVLWFQEGDTVAKRKILKSVGSNPILQNRKFSCEAIFPFSIERSEPRFSIGCSESDVVRTPTPRKRKASRRESTDKRQCRQILVYLEKLWITRDPKYLDLVDCCRELLARDEAQAREKTLAA